MKKLLVVLLALILCVTTLASCDFLKNFADIRNGETGEEDKKPVFNVDAAADYVYNLYKNKNTTASDFEVTAKVNILGAVHTVEWSVDTDKVTIDVKDENTFIVNVDEESPEELAYVLTATIKGGDKTATKSFNLTVPKYVLTPFEEYIDKTEGDVVVKGIVVAINSKAAGNTRNHLFLEDLNGKGGYYSYQMDADPVADLGIKVGMIVEVSGPVSPYSGMQEIKGGSARIVDPTIHEVKTFDITNAFANGESLKNYVGLLVTVKGVEITGQELGGTSEYLKFKLNGKEAYVRTYVTDFPTTLKADDKATIDAAHAEHFGWTANATGVLVLYSNNPYLIPVGVDCFEYLELIVKSDEEKIAGVLGEIKLGTSFTGDAVVDLPTAVYPEVTLTWESNSEYVVVADGKLTITVPNETVEAVLTLTATCGEKTEVKTFTIKLSKTATPVKDIIDLGASMDHNTYTESKYLVAGIITEVYDTKYGNMKITDEFGNILTIYGTYSADGSTRYDAMEGAPVAGDYVVILGVVGQYKGTPQIKNGWIMSVTTPTSVKDAIDTGAAQEHNTYTADKYIVTGVITEVYDTKYGNMKITDENGNILTIYGTYDATGTIRYDAMTNAPVAGDTVTIYGSLGQYRGTAQIKNGWLVAVTKGSDTPECTEHVDADGDEKCDTCGADMPNDNPPEVPATLAEQIAEAQKLANGAYLPYETTMTGTVVGAVQESSYTPGTWKLNLTDGTNTVTLYYVPVTGTPVEGCTITVTGKLTAYNGSAQFDETATAKVEGETPDTPSDDGLKLDLWKSDESLFVVDGHNIKYNGAGDTYACVGSNVADLAAGNNTFTVTITNNGAADTRVRFDLQGSVQVGNHKVCNVTAVGGDVWTDMEWGGSAVTVPAGQSVTLVITYDENTERGTVVDLIIFVDGARGDANTYSADITLSGMAFSKVENETPECKHTNTVVEGAIEATCDKAGFAGNTVCADCKEVIANGEEIPATGKHTFADGKCTVCGTADPNYTPDVPAAEWTLTTELKDGDLVLIGAPAYGKLLSTVKVATYYNKGVDYSADNFANVTDAEIFVVTVNADGSYTFTSLTGDVIALAGSYSSLNVDGENKSWTLKANGDGTFLVKNTGRGNYLEWYASKSNWSTHTAGNTTEYHISFYAQKAASGETPEPACKHTNTVVEGATEATCNTPGFTGNTVCADCKEVIANGTEIPATGKHTFADGKCTVCGAEDPDYVKPDAPVAGGSADFNTIVLPSSKPNGDSSYTGSYTTANGWVTNFSAIQCGGANDINPQFKVIGPDNTYKAVCLNGKVSAPGTITSPVLTGGISKLTINYTKMFTDTALSVTVTITDANGNKYTHVIEATLDKNEKYVVYTDEWVLETPITGDFTIEIVNNCPSQNTGNKDRFTILGIVWEGAAAQIPDEPVKTEPVTASKVIKDLIAEYGWTSSTTKQEFNLDENVTVKINGGNNTGKAYNGDHIRIYATDTPAGTITISVPEGYEIVSIKISAATDGTYAFLCVDGSNTDICNTVVSVSGSSVVLNSVKNGSNGKQIRVTAIEVIYQAIG